MTKMFQRDPTKRITIGEVWSIIDSLKDRMVKFNQYNTNKMSTDMNQYNLQQQNMTKSLSAMSFNQSNHLM